MTTGRKTSPWSYSGDKMKFIDIFKDSLLDGEFFSRCKHYFYDMPEALPWGGWADWDKKTKKKYPISWFFIDTLPDFVNDCWRPIKETYYHLKAKYIIKHHYIKIDVDRFFIADGCNVDHPLRNYHWYDSDTKILYVTFQILVDFVEQEKDIVDWKASPENQKTSDEFMALYNWWIKERPNRSDPFPSMSDYDLKHSDVFGQNINRQSSAYKQWSKAADEATKIEEEYNDIDTEMLIRLITIRHYMWT